MPSFNASEFVSESIGSILNQSFQDYELIIVDDGSTDDTVVKIEQFRDDRIKLIKKSVNNGHAAARNLGVDLSLGDYIAAMDSDDLCASDRLAIQYEYLKRHPKIGLVGSWAEVVNSKGQTLGEMAVPLDSKTINTSLMMENCFIHSTLFYQKSYLKKFQFKYDEKFKLACDYDFLFNFSGKAELANLGDPLVKYRVHDFQLSSKKKDQQIYFADLVRLKQLDRLKVLYTEKDALLHLKLMKGHLLSGEEIDYSIVWFNKLIQANIKYKVHDSNIFHNFLLKILVSNVNKIADQNIKIL
ncbi:glycosyltransferase [Pedobacter terrae]|nr:glycosyltransferase [Pedobacter terrae]